MLQSFILSKPQVSTPEPVQSLWHAMPSRIRRQSILLLTALWLAFAVSLYLPFDQLLLFLQQHKELPLAEAFFVALVIGVLVVIWLVLRQRELARQATAREALVKELEQKNQIAAQLDQLTNLLNSCAALEEASMVISHFAQQLFPNHAGGLYIFRHNRNILEGVAAWGMELSPESLFTPDQCWALRQGQLYETTSPEASILCQHVNHCDPYMCLPITSHGELLGLLHLHEKNQPVNIFVMRESDHALLVEFVKHIALAFSNLKLRDALRQQAIRDPLTGLYNRAYLDEMLTAETERARRNKAPYSIIMLDVDSFREFNDIYGHEAGDAVLQSLGRMLLRYTHGNDVAFRVGSEEFALLLPGATTQTAWKRVEEIVQGARTLRTEFGGQMLSPGSISAGVASFPNQGEHPAVIVEAADASLFQAKLARHERVAIPV